MCCLLLWCYIAVEVSLSLPKYVCVSMRLSEMNISFLPSYFSSSQHHVVNSFLILILNIHNLPMVQLGFLQSCLFLPATQRSIFLPPPHHFFLFLAFFLARRHFSYIYAFLALTFPWGCFERMLCVITVILGEK